MNDALRVLGGPVRLVRIGERAVDVPELESLVRMPGSGAVVVFLGTTRADHEDDGVIDALDYEAARPLADTELAAVTAEAAQRFALGAIAVHHALGNFIYFRKRKISHTLRSAPRKRLNIVTRKTCPEDICGNANNRTRIKHCIYARFRVIAHD